MFFMPIESPELVTKFGILAQKLFWMVWMVWLRFGHLCPPIASGSIWSVPAPVRGRGRGPGGRGGSRPAQGRASRRQVAKSPSRLRPRPSRSSRRARGVCSGAGRGVSGGACEDRFTLFGHVSTVLLQRPSSRLRFEDHSQ